MTDDQYLEEIKDIITGMKPFNQRVALAKGCPDPARYGCVPPEPCRCITDDIRPLDPEKMIDFAMVGAVGVICQKCGQVWERGKDGFSRRKFVPPLGVSGLNQ